MKTFTLMLLLIALPGCSNGSFFPGGYSSELAHKCQIDPYSADCLQPPAVLHN
jgi:hypothetical protein